MFQFLIGWLQTVEWVEWDISEKIVSIPYRLATNIGYFLPKREHLFCVSIPYRLATNNQKEENLKN